jgi:Tfp pilus tip-associated adhesin PilY1
VLGVGEKVLNPATTFANTVLFTSFTPANIGNACVPAGGLNRLYAVSVFDGRPQTNFDEPIQNEDFEPADRAVELEQGGIAPTPEVLPEFDDAVVVGTEIFEDVLLSPPLSRTFWFQREGP